MAEVTVPKEIDLPDSYDVYTELLSGLNSISPQRIGFSKDELVSAISNPDVAKTDILLGPRQYLIPQLAHVGEFSWLNEEYFSDKFPVESQERAIKHFLYIPGLEPGDEVVQSIYELSKQEGIVVVDYPDSDNEYLEKVLWFLDGIKVGFDDPIELGTQTYYAGKVKLKDGYKPDLPIKNFRQAFNEMIQMGLIPREQIATGASYSSSIDISEAQRIYPFYKKAFQRLNKHPCRQGLSPDEFFEVTVNKKDIAKLKYCEDDDVATMLIFGDDLSEYPWLNQAFYKQIYPVELENRQIMYFPALYTDIRKRGDINSQHVVNLIAKMCQHGNNEIIVAFDCCNMNRGFLNKYIEDLVNQTPEASLKFNELSVQKYVAIKTKPKG